MIDLISRQAAINEIEQLHEKPNAWLDKAVDSIKNLPSVQPEIIRCKDCENWDTTWQNDSAPNYHYCPIIDGTYRGDFYCGKSERRTDGINE